MSRAQAAPEGQILSEPHHAEALLRCSWSQCNSHSKMLSPHQSGQISCYTPSSWGPRHTVSLHTSVCNNQHLCMLQLLIC